MASKLSLHLAQMRLDSSDRKVQSANPSVARKQQRHQSDIENPKGLHLAKYIPLPPEALTSDRLYFYGWHIKLEWLQELAPNNIRFLSIGIDRIAGGIRYIRETSGYKDAELVNGLVEDGEQYDEQFQMGSDTVMRLVMLTVNLKYNGLCHRRPTEEQMQKLIQIFGGRQPRWYKDGRPKKQFWDYEIY